MNNAQAVAPPLQSKILQAIYQYLSEHSHYESLNCLQEETGIPQDPNLLTTSPQTLQNAILQYDETKLSAFNTNANQQELTRIEEILSKLKASDQTAVCSTVLTDHSHHAANILCITADPSASTAQYISGGADKQICVVEVESGNVLHKIPTPAPVLAIRASTDGLLVAGLMNGSSMLIDLSRGEVLQSYSHHKKWIVAVDWSTDGKSFATASHDGTVNLYHHISDDKYHLQRTYTFNSPVESIVWWSGTTQLFVALRETNWLYIIDMCNTQHLQQSQLLRYNLNNSGDTHVSFTVLHLSLSPDSNFLCCVTDRHRVILLAVGVTTVSTVDSTPNNHIALQVLNIYDLTNDGYSTPRSCWSRGGRYLYVTSQQKNSIGVYDITADGQRVGTLHSHTQIVRDICMINSSDQSHNSTNGSHTPTKQRLISGGYDHTIKVWK